MTALEPGASDVLTVGATVRPRATAFRASSPAPTITVGFEVFVQDVMAAMTTEPWPTSAALAIDLDRECGRPAPSAGPVCGKAAWKLAGRFGQHDAVLRPPRPGDRRVDGRQVKGQERVEVRAGAGLPPQPLLLRVALDERDPLPGPPRQAKVGERLVVDREEGRRSPRTRGSCSRSSPGRRATGRRGRRRRTRRTPRPRRTRGASRSRRGRGRSRSSRAAARRSGGRPTIRGIGW